MCFDKTIILIKESFFIVIYKNSEKSKRIVFNRIWKIVFNNIV